MKLSYSTALLRYCNDLTDPYAENVPVAAFLVAESDDSCYAAAAAFDISAVDALLQDTKVLSESMLEDLPQFIKRHVNEVFSDRTETPRIDQVLFDLEEALRNTLNVSDVSEVETLDVKEIDSLGSHVLDILTHRLFAAVQEYGVEVISPQRHKPLHALADRLFGTKAKPTVKYDLPSQTFWPVVPTNNSSGLILLPFSGEGG